MTSAQSSRIAGVNVAHWERGEVNPRKVQSNCAHLNQIGGADQSVLRYICGAELANFQINLHFNFCARNLRRKSFKTSVSAPQVFHLFTSLDEANYFFATLKKNN
jgi:hypothetical protein